MSLQATGVRHENLGLGNAEGGGRAAHPEVFDASGQAEIVVPGRDFIVNADYQRVGSDLILSANGREVVLRGYFDGNHPPTLLSGEGAAISGDLAARLAGPIAPGQYAQAGPATGGLGEAIGRVEDLNGQATVLHTDGTRSALAKGAPVYAGDVVQTGAGSTLGIVFVDKSTFVLGENARMVLDQMVYDPGTHQGSAVFNLLQGAFVTVTGEIGKTNHDAVHINTPVGSIGIRGTGLQLLINFAAGQYIFSCFEGAGIYTNNVGEIVFATGFATSSTGLNNPPGALFVLPPATQSSIFGAAKAMSDALGQFRSGSNLPDVTPGSGSNVQHAGPPLAPPPLDAPELLTSQGLLAYALLPLALVELETAGRDHPNPIPPPPETPPTSDSHVLVGTPDSDILIGQPSGNNLLKGLASPDYLDGGPGPNNTVTYGELTVDGVFYPDSPEGVIVDLSTGQGYGGDAEGDVIVNIQNLIGSGHDDILIGDANANVLDGGAGDDILIGGAGDDSLNGDAGDDALIGGAGDDTVNGGADNDTLLWAVGDGNDTFDGGDGFDRLDVTGTAGADDFSITAGPNGHVHVTGEGFDIDLVNVEEITIHGGGGDDVVTVGDLTGTAIAQDTIIFDGGDGNDTFDASAVNVHVEASGGGGDDHLIGGSGDDLLDGGDGADTMEGGTGNDVYVVDNTGDIVTENPDADPLNLDVVVSSFTYTLPEEVEGLQLFGTENLDGTGNDLDNLITGNDGDNVLDGKLGNDLILGGAGDDTLIGGADNDSLFGEAGNDTLTGGVGDDTLGGGADDDLYVYNYGDGNDTIFDDGGIDTLELVGLPDGGVSNVLRDGGNIVVSFANGDVLTGINHFAGNAVEYAIADDETFNIATGLTGGEGHDVIAGANSEETLAGNGGEDAVFGNGGDDTLEGGAGDDDLFGGDGDDVLVGGTGDDALTGGAGSDTFVYNGAADSPASDNIKDFTQGEDKIDLSALRGDTDLGWGNTTGGIPWAVWYGTNEYGNTDVFADTTGDGTPDLHFILNGIFALTPDDFIGVDGSAPTVTVDIADAALADGDTASNVTFTFSEAPSDFTADDLTVVGGEVTDIEATADPLVYTATFTADDGFSGTGSVAVSAGGYTDEAGNAGGPGADDVAIDRLNPTVTVDIADAALADSDTASNVTFTFSEVPSGFAADDLTAVGGTVTGLAATADPLVYTATFTATDGFSGTGSVAVDASGYTDAAGNSGGPGSDDVAIDRANPTVTVDILAASLSHGSPSSNVTFTFSEPTADFGNDDVTVVGGTLSGLTQDDATHWHATFTATEPFSGGGSVTVNAGSYHDAAGNAGSSGFDGVIIDPVLVMGSNADDGGGSDAIHAIPNPAQPDHGSIAGSASRDVLIGDPGGVEPVSYNLVFVFDVSLSIPEANLALMKGSANALLDTFGSVPELHVEVLSFRGFGHDWGSATTVAGAQALINAVNRDFVGTGSDYAAGLEFADEVVSELSAADRTLVYFLSDGTPTAPIDTVAELHALLTALPDLSASEINAVGFGVGDNETATAILDEIDNTGAGAQLVTDTNDLADAFGSPLVPLEVGADVLTGGDADDVIFGDAPNTDALTGTGPYGAAGTHDGAGYDVLLHSTLGLTTDGEVAEYLADPTDDYAHAKALNVADDTRGMGDTIDAGDGNDIVFGQGGDDLIFGGSGNDQIYGGTGNDTIVGGLGQDILRGDAGADIIRYIAPSDGGDTLIGFLSGTDTLEFETGFLGQFQLPADTPLTADNFKTIADAYDGANADLTNDDAAFVYSTSNRTLYYDDNGNAADGYSIVATVASGSDIAAADIHIVTASV